MLVLVPRLGNVYFTSVRFRSLGPISVQKNSFGECLASLRPIVLCRAQAESFRIGHGALIAKI